MKTNTGVYICTGCQIEKSIDITALADIAGSEYNIDVCRKHHAFCSEEGTALIRKDIENEDLGVVIIAACSPRVNTRQFCFGNNTITERVNLREQVVWCGEPNNEDTQMLAEDYLRMGIAKTRNISSYIPYITDKQSSDILVAGGGITGVTAAIEGARAGYDVILVEKEKVPGGWLNKLYKQLPTRPPYTHNEDPVIYDKLEELRKINNIKLYTSASIKEITGEPGNFDVLVKAGKSEKHFTVASIVAALGWKPYDAKNLTEFGYGQHKDIITNIELEEMAKAGAVLKPSDRKVPERVLFIQCAGSRSREHLPYCSSFCCGTSLKQAKYIRDINKRSSVFIIYKDIRTPGHYENFYKEVQKDEQIFLTKGEVSKISKEKNRLKVEISNTLLGEEISIEVDMVVLATGMVPADSNELNLKYRQGKGLPEIKYNFPDSHFICFPYETRRTGIYAAGAFRSPMDIAGCVEDARGAVLKAIQCMKACQKGEAVHPRSGDRYYPELYLDRCTDCKRCTEECPFGAYDETVKGEPLPNINRCRRCAICLGSCPERVINFGDFSINSVSEMIKSVNIPPEQDEKLRILAFVCENDAYPAFDMAGYRRLKYSAFVRIIPVRCIGSINNVWISDALAKGFDGILQIGCMPGENYQCHYMQGSELLETRAANFRETLKTMMLEPERIMTEFVEINDYNKIPVLIDNYVQMIKEIGPNPFKSL